MNGLSLILVHRLNDGQIARLGETMNPLLVSRAVQDVLVNERVHAFLASAKARQPDRKATPPHRPARKA